MNTLVRIVGMTAGFDPPSVSIAVGDTVQWINEDMTRPHTVSSDPVPSSSLVPPWGSGELLFRDDFSHTFATVGDVFLSLFLSSRDEGDGGCRAGLTGPEVLHGEMRIQ
jgi:hypothetical protein